MVVALVQAADPAAGDRAAAVCHEQDVHTDLPFFRQLESRYLIINTISAQGAIRGVFTNQTLKKCIFPTMRLASGLIILNPKFTSYKQDKGRIIRI
jgi:hypothetical protein